MTAEQPLLLVEPGLRSARLVDGKPLEGTTERHKVTLNPGESFPVGDVLAAAAQKQAAGIVLALDRGIPDFGDLKVISKAFRAGMPCFVYWPADQTVEVVDEIRLKSYWHHAWPHALLWRTWHAVNLVVDFLRLRGMFMYLRGTFRYLRGYLRGYLRALKRLLTSLVRMARGVPAPLAFSDYADLRSTAHTRAEQLIAGASPVPISRFEDLPSPEKPLPGLGAYLRLDYWAVMTSGGSFGHTCYVARHLSLCTEEFICLMAHPFALLDDLGVAQAVVEPCPAGSSEPEIMVANESYLSSLRTVFRFRKPAYLYERLSLGSYVGTTLSQEFQVPYIVEYNGSELSMARSFGDRAYEFEDVFERAESAAFAQATLISVVSEPIRESLVARGVDPAKILVNPNGAEPDVYKPPPADARAALRASLGFSEDQCVVGFTGTFGGWHGIDVLADALPRICAGDDSVRFLLVGDGAHKHQVDTKIVEHALAGRCVSTGRVPQQRGAELLGACDIFVSPHSSHMVDGRFFGSPTKLFEYMSMGGGIVASDLEQLGQVLRPALTPEDFEGSTPEPGDARAVLCVPGSVDSFVSGVLALVAHPGVRRALGVNARQAVLDGFSWQRHVELLWDFARRSGLRESPEEPEHRADSALPLIETGDAYKAEVQRQWNVDACGSQYAGGFQPESLEWYQEIERHRYQECPWMPETMEFARHAGKKVLEVGGGMGTDLVQFALNGAQTTDVDLSAGHLRHARRNFQLRGLHGDFVHQDAEELQLEDNAFDVVYSNGVIHHSPNSQRLIDEIWRVLRPGGKVIVMVYAEQSLHYWRVLFWRLGHTQKLLRDCSMGEIMSRSVELSSREQRPLVKVYTAQRLHRMFGRFTDVSVVKRQLTRRELPVLLRWMNVDKLGQVMGWNLVVKGRKPQA